MATFNIHDSVVQAAVIDAASRLAVATGATTEKTAAIAIELLKHLSQAPPEAPYAAMR